MSTETLSSLPLEQSDSSSTGGRWRLPLMFYALCLLLLLALCWPTMWSMVETWWRSETFAHGFLILPISLYLIWLKRDDLVALQPRPSIMGLAALALWGVAWMLGTLVDVQVVAQLGLVGMMIAVTWAVLGWAVVRTIMFPLGYLFFMVPIGEFLIPPMMEFTAEFSVKGIQFIGIPVYADGFFISLPSGDWSIVEGCSGVRYLIASIAVGTLYAYMFYYSWWRRAAFVLLAIGTPIIANGLRAIMIIMIGHYSDMKLATGVDHLLYGWLFFGIVIMLMFWVGSFWWDKAPEEVPSAELSASERDASISSYWWGLPFALMLVMAAPLAMRVIGGSVGGPLPQIPDPQASGGWVQVDRPLSSWVAAYKQPTVTRQASFERDGVQVDVAVFYYRDQTQGAELVNSQNFLIPQKHPVWQMRRAGPSSIELDGDELVVTQSVLRSRKLGLLIWEWYWIDGRVTANDYLAKLLEAWTRLANPGQGGFALVLSTPVDDQDELGHQALQSFVDAMWPAIDASLRDTR